MRPTGAGVSIPVVQRQLEERSWPDGPPGEARTTRGFLLWLAGIVVLAAGLRLGLLGRYFPERLVGDEFYYLETATEMARGAGHARQGQAHANWPPAQAFWLSLFVDPEPAPGQGQATTLLRAQIFLGTLLVLLIGLLANELFGARSGLLAAVLAALNPTLIAFSHTIWSETLFLVLLTAALTLAVRVQRGGGNWIVPLAGLAFGLAGLTREVAILIAGGVAVWWVWTAVPSVASNSAADSLVRVTHRSRAALQGLAMLVIAACVVLPWTWRNYRLLDRFVPVSSVSWMAIRQGNTFARSDWTRPPVGQVRKFVTEYYADPDEAGRVDRARKEALALIRAQQPAWAAKKLVRNTAMLFNPDSFLFKKISRGAYPKMALWEVRAALVLSCAVYMLTFVGGVLGIAAARGKGRRMFALGVAGTVYFLHLLALASPRYRLPILTILVVYGADALGRRFDLGLSKKERWVSALVLAAFFFWCVPYFRADALSLWRAGTYVDPFRP